VGAAVSAPLARALIAELAALPDAELAPLAERLAGLVANRAAPPSRPASPYLTADEAAALLRCRRRRIYELVGDGRLTRHGDGRRLLVRREEVERLAEGAGGRARTAQAGQVAR